MILQTPLALFLGLLAVPILALYVLKLQRPQHAVSSTLLWRQVLDDVQANAPWQRLRPNLLLVLQLLGLAALVAMLAGPAYSESRTFSGDLVLIVDQSPSMQATDVRPSRFSEALVQARALASQVGGGGVMSVIGMGGQPHLVVADSADRGVIDRGIDTLRPGVQPPNVEEALNVAQSLAREGQKTQVVVLTDRDSDVLTRVGHMQMPVKVIRIGGRMQDLGVISIRAAHQGGHTDVAVTVHNYGPDVAVSDLDLYADGQLADVRPVSVPPAGERTLFWTRLPRDLSRVQARLTRADDMPLDKTGQVVLPGAEREHVLLVTRGDPWLQAALSLGGSVALSTASPSVYAPVDSAGFDLVVFDGFLPHTLPATATLIAAPPAGRLEDMRFESAVSVTAPPTGVSGGSSLLRYVDLTDVHLSQLRSARLPAWLAPIVVSGRQVAVAAGSDGVRRVGLLAFDPQGSDWPLRVSFPVLIHNLLGYLTSSLSLDSSTVSAGRQVRLSTGPEVSAVNITMPNGATVQERAPFAPFTNTVIPGIYRVQVAAGGTGSAEFAVNAAVDHRAAGGPVVVTAGTRAAPAGHGARLHIGMAWIAALAALGLLSLEWWYAWRR